MRALGAWRWPIFASLAFNVILLALLASFALAPHAVGNRVANRLGLATAAQEQRDDSMASDAQTSADQAESDPQDAQSTIGDIASYGSSVADALDTFQSTTDDLDGRISSLEQAHQSACDWANSEAISFLGGSLFNAFEDYENSVC